MVSHRLVGDENIKKRQVICENASRYGGQMRMHWISSRGQPTGCSPSDWGLGEEVAGPRLKRVACYGILRGHLERPKLCSPEMVSWLGLWRLFLRNSELHEVQRKPLITESQRIWTFSSFRHFLFNTGTSGEIKCRTIYVLAFLHLLFKFQCTVSCFLFFLLCIFVFSFCLHFYLFYTNGSWEAGEL
jgi:hypothetical protein